MMPLLWFSLKSDSLFYFPLFPASLPILFASVFFVFSVIFCFFSLLIFLASNLGSKIRVLVYVFPLMHNMRQIPPFSHPFRQISPVLLSSPILSSFNYTNHNLIQMDFIGVMFTTMIPELLFLSSFR